MLLVIVVALRLGLDSWWTCHFFWRGDLVFLCIGENGGELHGNEGKKTSLGFSTFRWFVRCLIRCITSHLCCWMVAGARFSAGWDNSMIFFVWEMIQHVVQGNTVSKLLLSTSRSFWAEPCFNLLLVWDSTLWGFQNSFKLVMSKLGILIVKVLSHESNLKAICLFVWFKFGFVKILVLLAANRERLVTS